MTELDLGLKAGSRQLLWGMGFSTRVDVPLRGFSPPSEGRSRGPEAFTDLDVLGVAVAPGYALRTAIADCKTSRRESTSRMFWVRGVGDLFGSDEAYMVREHDVTDAARQLSAKLGITVLTAEDLTTLQGYHPLPDGSDLGILFDRGEIASHLAAFTGLDSRLRGLLDYRQFDFWVYEPHRNPVQLVAHLAQAANRLDARDPVHGALFFDLAWLYLVSLVGMTGYVRGAYLRDPDRALQEYLYGGPAGLKEKQQAARLLRSVAPDGAGDLDHLPAYYPQLRELAVRLLRRPGHLQDALRYLEIGTALATARRPVPVSDLLGPGYDVLAAKIVADVCGFLVAAADLDHAFRARARAIFLGEALPQASPPRSPVARRRDPPLAPSVPAADTTRAVSAQNADRPDDGLFDDPPSTEP
jgi:hypothetical protein